MCIFVVLVLVVTRLFFMKAYKPTLPNVAKKVVNVSQTFTEAPSTSIGWAFLDLGCGHGTMLDNMRRAQTKNGKALFEQVLGVELDRDIQKEAVKYLEKDSQNALCPVDVVCADMFTYVSNAFDADDAARPAWLKLNSLFYMYEPLWMASGLWAFISGSPGLPHNEILDMYKGMLTKIAEGTRQGNKEKESSSSGCEQKRALVIYIPQSTGRHVPKEMFLQLGYKLLHSDKVNQNGWHGSPVRSQQNDFEVWEV